MKLDVKAVAVTSGLLWALAIFLVGMASLIWTGYGQAFLEVVASIYPGYKGTASFGQVIVGTLYGLVDAVVGGAVFAWLYNLFAKA